MAKNTYTIPTTELEFETLVEESFLKYRTKGFLLSLKPHRGWRHAPEDAWSREALRRSMDS